MADRVGVASEAVIVVSCSECGVLSWEHYGFKADEVRRAHAFEHRKAGQRVRQFRGSSAIMKADRYSREEPTHG